jgi:Na+/melibiose symporter-like transporter
MSLVPQLTCSRKRRDILNGRRNTFTFIANIQVLVVALILFSTVNQDLTFPIMALMTAGIGLGFTAFFLSTIKEVPLTRDCQRYASNLKKILKRKF